MLILKLPFWLPLQSLLLKLPNNDKLQFSYFVFREINIMDNMISLMEKYTDHLEETVAERTQQLEEEKAKTDALLYRMLPQ